MTPWQEAKQWHLKHNPEHPFEAVLAEHLTNGVVYSGPDVFVMAKPVLWEDGFMYYGDVDPNCWHVFLAAGNFKRLLGLAPRRLSFVAWQRRGQSRYRVWTWDKFNKRIKNGNHDKITATA